MPLMSTEASLVTAESDLMCHISCEAIAELQCGQLAVLREKKNSEVVCQIAPHLPRTVGSDHWKGGEGQ